MYIYIDEKVKPFKKGIKVFGVDKNGNLISLFRGNRKVIPVGEIVYAKGYYKRISKKYVSQIKKYETLKKIAQQVIRNYEICNFIIPEDLESSLKLLAKEVNKK